MMADGKMNWRTPPPAIQEGLITDCEQSDIVVVGLGYAGSAALRAARESGARVIGLEAMPEQRYHLFGRDVGHINSEFLNSRGIPSVDPQELFQEWMRRASNRANPALVMTYCQQCGRAFDWYTDMYGAEGLKDLHVAFWPKGGEKWKESLSQGTNEINGYRFWYGTAQFPDPMGWKGGPTLPACAKANLDKAEKQGAAVRYGMTGVQLVTQPDGGVTGVIARDMAGNYHRYEAKRAVILAAGDFSGNHEMVQDLCCDVEDLMSVNAPPRGMGRRGQGIQMGVWAGGRLESRPIPTMGGNGLILSSICGFGAVWLDQDGNRFCNEVFGGPELTGFSGNQRGIREVLVLFDEHCLEHELAWAVPAHGGFDANVEGVEENLTRLIRYAYAGGTQPYSVKLPMPLNTQKVYYGRTPEELAEHAGLTPETAAQLSRSVHRYHEMCAAGRDTDFGRDPKVLDPLTGMLFLQRVTPQPFGQIMVTVGGLLTDDRQQVLDKCYRPIGGLFATGNCCGRRFGLQYTTPISGVSIGMAITLGREAGKLAARYER